MQSDISLSIIIPTLNEQERLPLLLEDLVNQTTKDFEVIIVDAHSTDKTKANADPFAPKLNSYSFYDSPKKGVCFQRNYGAEKAKSNWLVFFDADSRIPPYFVRGLQYLIDRYHPNYFVTYFQPDSNNPTDKVIAKLINTYIDLYAGTQFQGGLEAMCVFEKQIFMHLNGFKESLKWGEGGDIGKRAYELGYKMLIFKEPVYTFSFRRMRDRGTLSTARATAQLELARLFRINLPQTKVAKLYPMEGGKIIQEESTIERMLRDVKKIQKLPVKFIKNSPTSQSIIKILRSPLNLFDLPENEE